MAINRYLYPPSGTNIVKQVTLATRVAVASGGAVGATICGDGITIAPVNLVANPGLYNVTLDNASSVFSIVCARAGYVSAYAGASHIQFHVVSVTTTGCQIQAYQANSGATGNVNVDGSLWVELNCQVSGVVA